MILQDDRTEAQRESHPIIWMGTDSFLSGWGRAGGGPSYAGWACTPEDDYECEWWVRGRSDMRRVRQVVGTYRPPSGPGHVHIYLYKGQGA